MENSVLWLAALMFGGVYLIVRLLEKMLKELSAIRLTLEEIETRGRPASPENIQDWIAARNEPFTRKAEQRR